MNIFGITSLACGVSCLILGFIAFRFGKAKIHRILASFNISVAIWGVGCFFVAISPNESAAISGWKIAHIGGIFVSIFFYHMVATFCRINRKLIIWTSYVIGLFFLFLDLFSSILFNETRLIFNSLFYNVATPAFNILAVLWFILVALGFFELIRFLPASKGNQRIQALYIIFGFLTGFLGGTSTFLPEFGIDYIYPFGNIGIPAYCLILTYSILKYRLMDLKVAITRTGIFVAVYTLVLGLPLAMSVWGRVWLKQLFGENWWISPLGLMVVLALGGPFIYIFLQGKAEDKLLAEQKRYQNTLKQASVGMTRVRNLRKLLQLITHIITRIVKITNASVYLYDKRNDEYVLQASRDRGKIPALKLAVDNPLVVWITSKREPLIYEEVKRLAEDTADATFRMLAENMHQLHAFAIIPSFMEDRFIGFLVLGEKISGEVYSPEDLNVFQVLASQAALAIENAQFYEDAKTMQEQIAQAEKMATIGTMADGLSHQINNRFNALSLIAGDSLDTLKNLDMSKCTPEMKNLIADMQYSLERIQSNVMQGGEVVRGLLKYSRKGDSGLEALNLNDVLNNTIDMVQYKVKLSEIDIARNFHANTPKLKGNMTQLQEVFFNLIDNAYDAIVERRTTLNEKGYRGAIIVTARPVENFLEIVVEDNGMGVKGDNNEKVFTPFFTTKTSSKKGTGLGLYVIKRIVTELHGGKIAFESRYQQGTKFTIQLPLAE